MKKELQKALPDDFDDNFDEKNIENVRKAIEDDKVPPPKVVGMFLNESGNGKDPAITEESIKICAEALINHS